MRRKTSYENMVADSYFTGMGEWHETAHFAIHLSWAVDVYAMGNG